ncbi:CPBP family intramembrane glutamic endopeptidase [Paenibacillus turpanensis]|uniref:CPBP family intramembrane glutamic endopeptidase n=1 Tax=Paenibacillus turpanensis TaxID=2689078 RepID=UPI0014085AC3|nr:type II CAAX endopeptidase family protein [Paenibacillus turpanensis]
MKKFDPRKIRFRQVRIDEIDDRTLMLNLYATQAITLVLGVVLILFQGRNPVQLLFFPSGWHVWLWGALFAAAVIVVDILISKWVPEEVTDDGGVNARLFQNRSILHIVVISFVVSICEEMLFRGAIQHAFGPYWTSILFAAIHVRYLRHWLLTGLVFGISYGLGWIYVQTESLWAPITAHFVIDTIMGLIIRYRKPEENMGEKEEESSGSHPEH